MITITLEQFLAEPLKYLTAAAECDDVMILRGDTEWCVLTNATARPEDIAYTESDAFWDMMHARQAGPHIPWDEANTDPLPDLGCEPDDDGDLALECEQLAKDPGFLALMAARVVEQPIPWTAE